MNIRDKFLNFFKNKRHKIAPSAPLVPNDASLLFVNAGMVPFKSIFTGQEPIPNPPRMTSCQTCIRAGGKHNDLDNVGYTARHHTFFEMLGNFSFGDYFKKDAISFAWEFITKDLELPKDKLYVTVHENDDEAFNLWLEFVEPERIYRFGDKDNFWQMGETGPCGPCSEIFYDQGEENFSSPEDKMGGDGDRFLEIWNLVFMQYERDKSGELKPLPKPSIDTGMGLERITAIKEGKLSNYDSSLFMPIINEIEKISKVKYFYESGASFRVISDHIRTVTFLLAQGVNFDKEGRGYVLRRITRRALRHGYLLGMKEPFLYKLVDIVVELMGEHYTYLKEKKEVIKELILLEEKRFLSTISSGIELFNNELKNTNEIFSGEVAFKLYDTYGFPLDLTIDMLREKGLSVNEARFEELMKEQKQLAKASWKGSGDRVAQGDFKNILEKFKENDFVGYSHKETNSKILSILDENFKEINELKNGQIGWIMFDKTPFYSESGGQCGDNGELNSSLILDSKKFFGLHFSKVDSKENLKIGEKVYLKVSSDRNEIERHHSATHLLQAALKKLISQNISQAGSSVLKDRLRFDFSYPKALTLQEIEKIENLVNKWILEANDTLIEHMDLEDAKKSGAIAMFDEKYGHKVRVLSIANHSKELCGGTHVKNSSEIGMFFITKESSVSSGVRRIEAVCSKAALNYIKNYRAKTNEASTLLKTNDLNEGIIKLKNRIKSLEDELKNSNDTKELPIQEVNGAKVIICEFDGNIKSKIDEFKNRFEKIVIVLFKTNEDRVEIACGIKNLDLKAGTVVKSAAAVLGGNGGGRDDFATAGAKDISNLQEAINLTKSFIREKLSGN